MGRWNPKKKKRASIKSSKSDSSDKFCSGEAILQYIESPEGINRAFLENLYKHLVSLCSNEQNAECVSASHEIVVCHRGMQLCFRNAWDLSDILFKEIQEKFETLLSSFYNAGAKKNLGVLDKVEVFTLLFRCCMLVLILLAGSQDHIVEKGLILLKILKKFASIISPRNTRKRAYVFEKSVLRESSVDEFSASLQILEPRSPFLCLRCSILEVFIDELLAHGRLRGYFKLINSLVSVGDILFNPRYSCSDIGVVFEAICFHFIVSFSSKQGLGEFLSSLFCFHAKESRFPLGAATLSINGAISLLLSPILVSAPKYLLVHVISLVSEVIDIKILESDKKMVNCFLSTFEKSVILYMTHMYSWKNEGFDAFLGGFAHISPKDTSQLQFEAYVSPETRRGIDKVIDELNCSLDLSSSAGFFMMKSNTVSSCMRFVKECQNAYAMQSQDEAFVILTCLVLKASKNCDYESVQSLEGETLQHISLVVSLLKLMSISMLQAIRSLRDSNDFHCTKVFTSCKEYIFMLNTIKCFRDLDATLPLQQVVSHAMASHPSRNIDSKMMFLHFSGLLSLSFASGLDCLAKGSLLAILAILNFFVFEDGGRDALKSMLISLKESLPSELSMIRIKETSVGQNSSLVVALKFQMTRSLCSRENGDDTECLKEEEAEETCNGEMFLKCIVKNGKKGSDLNDIIDFVECKQGKDYSAWLKNRGKFRRWRNEKTALLRWRKRKRSWKSISGNLLT